VDLQAQNDRLQDAARWALWAQRGAWARTGADFQLARKRRGTIVINMIIPGRRDHSSRWASAGDRAAVEKTAGQGRD
jgi:hypothetical protein